MVFDQRHQWWERAGNRVHPACGIRLRQESFNTPSVSSRPAAGNPQPQTNSRALCSSLGHLRA